MAFSLILAGIETVRATGAEARMQTAWERSVAATARTGEDVHFWASLALTSASTAQQLTTLLMIVIGVFLILDGKLSVGALVAASMLAGRVLAPISGIAAVLTRATQTFTALKSIDRVMSLERERPLERSYVARKIVHGSIAFENVTFRIPAGRGYALERSPSKSRPGSASDHWPRRVGQDHRRPFADGFYEPAEGQI